MANVDGKWKTVVASPIGDQTGVLTVDSSGNSFMGTWSLPAGSVAVTDGKGDGDELSWNATLTIPMPMAVNCKATVTGDTMSGTCKAGSFRSFPLTGTPGERLRPALPRALAPSF